MNEPKRRFFSGDSLQQALVQAANHFHLDPEEIAYRSIEKKHGFIKVRRKVMIEVNPDAPRREKGAPPPPTPGAPATPATPVAVAPHVPPRALPADVRPRETGEAPADRPVERREPRRDEHHDRGPQGRGGRDRGGDRGPQGRRDDRGARPARGPRDGGLREARERAATAPARLPGGDPEAPRHREPGILEAGGLVNLPDAPRRVSERFPPAEGAQAAAAAKGAELLLRIAGLELAPRVLQGEDRLEVDLAGADVDWCFADDGELVLAIEHLLPRLIRSLSGEPAMVRVDCDNFQEIREERLRSLAQRMAEEVRRFAKPRTLEPMNPADRRIIHVTLADDPHVVTESEGDGYFKRVMIRPA